MSSFNPLLAGANPTPGRGDAAAPPDLVVAATRPRQTAVAASPFRDVLTGGVGLLIRGVEVATSVVAGPVMAAAVRGAGADATTALAGSAPGRPGGAAAVSSGAALSATLAGPAGAAGGTAGSAGPDLAAVQAMQRESQSFNLQLLELQEDVQQENRRFTTISNVLRAKHDTAKAAVSNIRS
jgi:hypothetical protein